MYIDYFWRSESEYCEPDQNCRFVSGEETWFSLVSNFTTHY